MIVDVRDVAQAVLVAYAMPEAEGRYICTGHHIKARDLVEELRSIYPDYNYPNKYGFLLILEGLFKFCILLY